MQTDGIKDYFLLCVYILSLYTFSDVSLLLHNAYQHIEREICTDPNSKD